MLCSISLVRHLPNYVSFNVDDPDQAFTIIESIEHMATIVAEDEDAIVVVGAVMQINTNASKPFTVYAHMTGVVPNNWEDITDEIGEEFEDGGCFWVTLPPVLNDDTLKEKILEFMIEEYGNDGEYYVHVEFQ